MPIDGRQTTEAYRAAAQEAGDPDADGPQGLSCCGLSKHLVLGKPSIYRAGRYNMEVRSRLVVAMAGKAALFLQVLRRQKRQQASRRGAVAVDQSWVVVQA